MSDPRPHKVGTERRTSLYTFGVLYFDVGDRVCGVDWFCGHAPSLEAARSFVNREMVFAIGPNDAVVAQVYSVRDVCLMEFRRPVTIEAKKSQIRPVFQ